MPPGRRSIKLFGFRTKKKSKPPSSLLPPSIIVNSDDSDAARCGDEWKERKPSKIYKKLPMQRTEVLSDQSDAAHFGSTTDEREEQMGHSDGAIQKTSKEGLGNINSNRSRLPMRRTLLFSDQSDVALFEGSNDIGADSSVGAGLTSAPVIVDKRRGRRRNSRVIPPNEAFSSTLRKGFGESASDLNEEESSVDHHQIDELLNMKKLSSSQPQHQGTIRNSNDGQSDNDQSLDYASQYSGTSSATRKISNRKDDAAFRNDGDSDNNTAEDEDTTNLQQNSSVRSTSSSLTDKELETEILMGEAYFPSVISRRRAYEERRLIREFIVEPILSIGFLFIALMLSSYASFSCKFMTCNIDFYPQNIALKQTDFAFGPWGFMMAVPNTSSSNIVIESGTEDVNYKLQCLRYPSDFARIFIKADPAWTVTRTMTIFSITIGWLGFILTAIACLRVIRGATLRKAYSGSGSTFKKILDSLWQKMLLGMASLLILFEGIKFHFRKVDMCTEKMWMRDDWIYMEAEGCSLSVGAFCSIFAILFFFAIVLIMFAALLRKRENGGASRDNSSRVTQMYGQSLQNLDNDNVEEQNSTISDFVGEGPIRYYDRISDEVSNKSNDDGAENDENDSQTNSDDNSKNEDNFEGNNSSIYLTTPSLDDEDSTQKSPSQIERFLGSYTNYPLDVVREEASPESSGGYHGDEDDYDDHDHDSYYDTKTINSETLEVYGMDSYDDKLMVPNLDSTTKDQQMHNDIESVGTSLNVLAPK